jgi:hypothetical protein
MPRRRSWRESIQQGLDNPRARWAVQDGVARFNGILTVRSDGTLTGAGLAFTRSSPTPAIHETFEPGIEEVGYNQYAYTLAGERVPRPHPRGRHRPAHRYRGGPTVL